jgi:hypothetical protein
MYLPLVFKMLKIKVNSNNTVAISLPSYQPRMRQLDIHLKEPPASSKYSLVGGKHSHRCGSLDTRVYRGGGHVLVVTWRYSGLVHFRGWLWFDVSNFSNCSALILVRKN